MRLRFFSTARGDIFKESHGSAKATTSLLYSNSIKGIFKVHVRNASLVKGSQLPTASPCSFACSTPAFRPPSHSFTRRAELVPLRESHGSDLGALSAARPSHQGEGQNLHSQDLDESEGTRHEAG